MFWWQGRLLLAGTGPSDHGEALLLPGFESCAGDLLEALLADIDQPIERIEWHQLRAGSPLLAAAAPRGWRDHVEAGEACPVLPLAGSDGIERIPQAHAAQLALLAALRSSGRARASSASPTARRAKRCASSCACTRCAGPNAAKPACSPIRLLRRLLEDAGPALAAAGLLRMQRLVVGTQTAAVLFALHGDGQTCCFLSGFDPAFARLSPVTALIGATIAQAARDGDRSVDFLRGEEPYKLGWGAVPQAMHRRSFVRV